MLMHSLKVVIFVVQIILVDPITESDSFMLVFSLSLHKIIIVLTVYLLSDWRNTQNRVISLCRIPDQTKV